MTPGVAKSLTHSAALRGRLTDGSSVALHTIGDKVVLATSVDFRRIQLISMNLREMTALKPITKHKQLLYALYKGHQSQVQSIPLHTANDQMSLFTGSEDRTVGLLQLTHSELEKDFLGGLTLMTMQKWADLIASNPI